MTQQIFLEDLGQDIVKLKIAKNGKILTADFGPWAKSLVGKYLVLPTKVGRKPQGDLIYGELNYKVKSII